MKILFSTIAIIAMMQVGFAQDSSYTGNTSPNLQILDTDSEEGIVTFRKQLAGGIKLTNDGYGVFFEMGKYKSPRTAMLFQLDIAERKHVKETKAILNPSNPNPLIYGKINFVYPIKLGVQYQYLLGNKGNKNGVHITANGGGGLSLALLRAYQVEVRRSSGNTMVYYDSPDSLAFLNINKETFAVGPSLFKAWNKLSMVPGIYTKASLRFDYALFPEVMNALEFGLAAEYYSKAIPQMVRQKPKNFFVSPYISLIVGLRK